MTRPQLMLVLAILAFVWFAAIAVLLSVVAGVMGAPRPAPADHAGAARMSAPIAVGRTSTVYGAGPWASSNI